MDSSALLLQLSTWLLVFTSLGGLAMSYVRFAWKVNPPSWLAMAHGFLAAAGVALLAYAALAVRVPQLAVWGLILLLAAAAGGVTMHLAYHLRKIVLPQWLVVAHAMLAVIGFTMVVLAAFGARR